MSRHIDMAPTWLFCVKVYLAVLDNPTAPESSKADARSEIERLARIADRVIADNAASKAWWQR